MKERKREKKEQRIENDTKEVEQQENRINKPLKKGDNLPFSLNWCHVTL
jgi:hypothetical protein